MTPEQFTRWRERLGWTRAKAAEELGCAPNSITAWENGRTKIPKYIHLACQYLKVEDAHRKVGELQKARGLIA